MRNALIFILAGTLIFSSCASPLGVLPSNSNEITPSITETQTPDTSPTATIIWFPATATNTPIPTIKPSATKELLPGLGAQVYQNDFSDTKKWSSSQTESAGANSIILDQHSLTLAINNSPASLFSLNNELIVSNFYAEVNVSINRCSGQDTYGMLYRAASGAYAYRFLLNCSGYARVEQIKAGQVTGLQEWVPSGDAPAGAPGQVKMAVWAAGNEMRFFLNGRHQFTIYHSLFSNGGLGVYANSSNPEGVNVNFSDLIVNSVVYVSPTPTATPTRTPTSTRTPRPTP